MRKIDVLVAILVVIGALNWGLYGAINLDLVALVFGEKTMLARLVYVLVGLSGVYQIVFLKGIKARWHVS